MSSYGALERAGVRSFGCSLLQKSGSGLRAWIGSCRGLAGRELDPRLCGFALRRRGVSWIAQQCGFSLEETMRRSFLRMLAATPQNYRARFSA